MPIPSRLQADPRAFRLVWGGAALLLALPAIHAIATGSLASVGWMAVLGGHALLLTRRDRVTGHVLTSALFLMVLVPPMFGWPTLGMATLIALPLVTLIAMPRDEALSWTFATVAALAALAFRVAVVPTSLEVSWVHLVSMAVAVAAVAACCYAADTLLGRWAAETDSLQARLTELEARQDALVNARDAALRSSAAKDRFLSMMSFELRTPLTTIVGYSEMLDELLQSVDPDAARDARTICTSSGNLLNVVDRVLDLARLQSGQLELKHHPIEPHRIVQYAIDQMDAPHVRIETSIHPVGMVLGDGVRLGQTVVALLERAVKRSDAGTVSIHLSRDDGGFLLRIRDDGRAIPLSGGAATPTEGLELTLARALTQRMSGTLDIERCQGGGSRVTVRMGLRQAFVPSGALPLRRHVTARTQG